MNPKEAILDNEHLILVKKCSFLYVNNTGQCPVLFHFGFLVDFTFRLHNMVFLVLLLLLLVLLLICPPVLNMLYPLYLYWVCHICSKITSTKMVALTKPPNHPEKMFFRHKQLNRNPDLDFVLELKLTLTLFPGSWKFQQQYPVLKYLVWWNV